VVIFTNGYLLTESIIKQLEDLGVYKLEISILGIDDRTYKKICGVPGASHIKELLPILSDTKMDIRLKTPVLAANYRQIPAIRELCLSYGLRYFYDVAQMTHGLYRDIDPNVFCSADQIAWLLDRIGVNEQHKNSFRENTYKSPDSAICYAGSYSFAIDAKGNVFISK
jgi:MoaA/NifB/PqqE/SkfB family radical SAM enzyme